jgi:hypothetical protein
MILERFLIPLKLDLWGDGESTPVRGNKRVEGSGYPVGGEFLLTESYFSCLKKSSPHHPITPSPHPPRQFLTENENTLLQKGGDVVKKKGEN